MSRCLTSLSRHVTWRHSNMANPSWQKKKTTSLKHDLFDDESNHYMKNNSDIWYRSHMGFDIQYIDRGGRRKKLLSSASKKNYCLPRPPLANTSPVSQRKCVICFIGIGETNLFGRTSQPFLHSRRRMCVANPVCLLVVCHVPARPSERLESDSGGRATRGGYELCGSLVTLAATVSSYWAVKLETGRHSIWHCLLLLLLLLFFQSASPAIETKRFSMTVCLFRLSLLMATAAPPQLHFASSSSNVFKGILADWLPSGSHFRTSFFSPREIIQAEKWIQMNCTGHFFIYFLMKMLYFNSKNK